MSVAVIATNPITMTAAYSRMDKVGLGLMLGETIGSVGSIVGVWDLEVWVGNVVAFWVGVAVDVGTGVEVTGG